MEPADRPSRAPARTLDEALARMSWVLEGEEYRLAVFTGPPGPALVDALGAFGAPAQVVLEPGATTVLAPARALAPLLEAHPGARVEAQLAWIRFEAPMGWELVGFLAHVTGRLAAAGVPLGVVCSFDRDHLFVARRHLDAARRVLEELFPGRGPAPEGAELR